MKRIFIASLLLLGCTYEPPADLEKTLKNACSCFGGAASIVYDNNGYSIVCKNGTTFKGSITSSLKFYCEK